jgi:sterol desaturase/sphingolipid hydroxylase (fatty acid hydroxylase superfamily)
MKTLLIRLIQHFPKGSIWQTRYICLPLVVIFSTLAISHAELDWSSRAGWFALGALSWTLLEYILHRWVLHWRPSGEVSLELVKRLHLYHHDDPKDESQVCVPIFLSAPAWVTIFGAILIFGGNPGKGILFTCGLALMSVVYDLAHFSAHYMKATNGLLASLKKQHMLHHFSDHTRRFGVTSPIWDYVFRTHR